MSEATNQYDVVIVGGGLVGALVALALEQVQQRVLVIEKNKEPLASSKPLHAGTLALSLGTVQFLQQLQVWSRLVLTPTAIERVKINVARKLGASTLSPDPQQEALGFVVGFADLQSAMLEQLKHRNIPVIFESEVQSHRLSQKGWRLEYSHPQGNRWVQSRLLICADGKGSQIASQYGIQWEHAKVTHHAVLANLHLKASHHGQAIERFFDKGTFATLPWQQDLLTNVWSLSEQDAKQLLQYNDGDFIAQCVQQVPTLTQQIQAVSQRKMVALNMALACSQSGPRLLLMGNAAHFLHPIAAQGFNLSVRDVRSLVNLVEKTPRDKVGSANFLQHYVGSRQTDQAKIIGLTSFLSVYVATQKIPRTLQSFALGTFDGMSHCRQAFTRFAMGV